MKPKDMATVKAAAETHSNGHKPVADSKSALNPELRPWPEKMQGRLDRAYGRLVNAEKQVTAMQQQLAAVQNGLQQEHGRFHEALEFALEEVGLPLDTNVRFVEGRIELAERPKAEVSPVPAEMKGNPESFSNDPKATEEVPAGDSA